MDIRLPIVFICTMCEAPIILTDDDKDDEVCRVTPSYVIRDRFMCAMCKKSIDHIRNEGTNRKGGHQPPDNTPPNNAGESVGEGGPCTWPTECGADNVHNNVHESTVSKDTGRLNSTRNDIGWVTDTPTINNENPYTSTHDTLVSTDTHDLPSDTARLIMEVEAEHHNKKMKRVKDYIRSMVEEVDTVKGKVDTPIGYVGKIEQRLEAIKTMSVDEVLNSEEYLLWYKEMQLEITARLPCVMF